MGAKQWDIMRLAGLHPDCTIVDIPDREHAGNVQAVHISSLSGLIQTVGYIKYISPSRVFFRGQRFVYGTQLPQASLYRSNSDIGTADAKIKKLLSTVLEPSDYDDSLIDFYITLKLRIASNPALFTNLRGVPTYLIEPLFQHYGIQTRWLDLTNSLPYALFFSLAAYGAPITTKKVDESYSPLTNGTTLSRVFRNVPVTIPKYPSDMGYTENVYLYALSFGKTVKSMNNGVDEVEGGHLMDLREATPSLYLRPHAQHGCLYLRNNSASCDEPIIFDNTSIVKGALFELSRKDVLSWLGSGELFRPESIYPPIRAYCKTSSTTEKHCSNPLRTVDQGLHQVEQAAIKLIRSASDDRQREQIKIAQQLVNYVTERDILQDILHPTKGSSKNTHIDYFL